MHSIYFDSIYFVPEIDFSQIPIAFWKKHTSCFINYVKLQFDKRKRWENVFNLWWRPSLPPGHVT